MRVELLDDYGDVINTILAEPSQLAELGITRYRIAKEPEAPVVIVPAPVPQVVSFFQGCAALMQAGFLDDVDAYMLTADPFEQLAWRSITEMRRDSPMTEKLGLLLGMTDEMIDDLFRFAASIQA